MPDSDAVRVKGEVNRLLQHYASIKGAALTGIPSAYAIVEQACITEDLVNEVKKLNELFQSEADTATLKTKFKELCAARSQQNKSTALSYAALPESDCNYLYWQIADKLFAPKNIQEMMAILLPEIITTLHIKIDDEEVAPKTAFTKRGVDRVILTYVEEPLSKAVTHIDPKQTETAKYVQFVSHLNCHIMFDRYIFPIDGIEKYTFPLHTRVHELLDEYPELKKSLYKHNDDLQALETDIELFNQKGLTPNEAIISFITDLERSGQRFTKKKHASNVAIKAIGKFQSYLDRLPEDTRKKLLGLQGNNKTIQWTLDQLVWQGECVEVTAGRLRNIQSMPDNKDFLNAHIHLSQDQRTQIIKKYKSKSLKTLGKYTTTELPDNLLASVLSGIRIDTAEACVDMLLNLPPEKYELFFRHSNINSSLLQDPAMVQVMKIISSDPKKSESLMTAIMANEEKLGGKYLALEFCIEYASAKLFIELLSKYPKKEWTEILAVRGVALAGVKNNRHDTVIDIIKLNPGSFYPVFNVINQRGRANDFNIGIANHFESIIPKANLTIEQFCSLTFLPGSVYLKVLNARLNCEPPFVSTLDDIIKISNASKDICVYHNNLDFYYPIINIKQFRDVVISEIKSVAALSAFLPAVPANRYWDVIALVSQNVKDIVDAKEFTEAFSKLDKYQKIALVDAMKDRLIPIIKTVADFKLLADFGGQENAQYFFNEMKKTNQLSLIINRCSSMGELSALSKYISKEGYNALVQDKIDHLLERRVSLSEIIGSIEDVAEAGRTFTTKQFRDLMRALVENPPEKLITSSADFIKLCTILESNNRDKTNQIMFFHENKNLPALIDKAKLSASDMVAISKMVSFDDFISILNIRSRQEPPLIASIDDWANLVSCYWASTPMYDHSDTATKNRERYSNYVNHLYNLMKDELSKHIKHGSDLVNVLYSIPENERMSLLRQQVGVKSTKLSIGTQSYNELVRLFNGDHAEINEFYQVMKNELPSIITKPEGLIDCRFQVPREFILDRFVHDEKDFMKMLANLPDPFRRTLFINAVFPFRSSDGDYYEARILETNSRRIEYAAAFQEEYAAVKRNNPVPLAMQSDYLKSIIAYDNCCARHPNWYDIVEHAADNPNSNSAKALAKLVTREFKTSLDAEPLPCTECIHTLDELYSVYVATVPQRQRQLLRDMKDKLPDILLETDWLSLKDDPDSLSIRQKGLLKPVFAELGDVTSPLVTPMKNAMLEKMQSANTKEAQVKCFEKQLPYIKLIYHAFTADELRKLIPSKNELISIIKSFASEDDRVKFLTHIFKDIKTEDCVSQFRQYHQKYTSSVSNTLFGNPDLMKFLDEKNNLTNEKKWRLIIAHASKDPKSDTIKALADLALDVAKKTDRLTH